MYAEQNVYACILIGKSLRVERGKEIRSIFICFTWIYDTKETPISFASESYVIIVDQS
jgi:hypothetical protein